MGVGIIYIAAGWYFGIPMPVQPLKAFAAIAISAGVGPGVIAAGALTIGAVMALLALTGAINLVVRATPLPVVRGVQFGLGLILLKGALLGPAPLELALPGPGDFATAAMLLVIPQLPLILANSVISMADVARLYFGDQAARVTPRAVALSYALGNLWAGLAGGLPNCHGAGGLTAHYRLGARTPAASLVIGTTLALVALLFGRSALTVRALVPLSVYGALLLYVGWEHLLLGLRVERRRDLLHVLVVGAVSLYAGGNLAVGAAAGLASYGLLRGAHRP